MTEEDRFERALDKLAADRSPREEAAGLSEEEQRMLRVAQLIHGSGGQDVDPDFAERLYGRIFPQRRISRRAAFLSGIGGLAAGVFAGVGLGRSTRRSSPQAIWMPLVGAKGRWMAVGSVADLPHGSVQPFTAGAVQGFLLNQHGTVRALSRICTHMGCTLQFDSDGQYFACPCHGAEFEMNGALRYGPRHYPIALPPLPEIRTRVNGQTIEVWSV